MNKKRPYGHDNDFALVRCLVRCLNTSKIVGGITLAAMNYYDGLIGCSKGYIARYIVHEHATVFYCQARAVDLCCWEFWKRGCMASDA